MDVSERAPETRSSRTDWLIAAVLSGLVLLFVWRNLAPSSLWLDDAWQALVVKAHSLNGLVLVSVTAPGYTLLLKGMFNLVGFSELTAQLPSVLFAMVLPGTAYVVARRRSLNAVGALLAATLLLSSPVLLTYASHVKQSSLNALLSMALLALGWLIVESGGTPKQWLVLLALACFATIMSGALAPTAGAIMLAATIADRRRGRKWQKSSLVALAGFGFFGILWWVLFLRQGVNPSLVGFWNDFYIGANSPLSVLEGATIALVRLAQGFTSVPVWVSCPVLFLSTVAVVQRNRMLALLFLSPVLISLALAAIRIDPLGTGRTDTQLYPGMALLIAFAANGLLGTTSIRTGMLIAAVFIGLLPFFVPLVTPYPQEDVRPLIQLINGSEPETPVVVYGWTSFAFPLYTDRAISFIKSADPTGFGLVYRDPDVLQLAKFDTPEGLQSELQGFVDHADTVWFVASHFRPNWPDDFSMTSRTFEMFGYRVERRWDRPGALLIKWVRTSQTADLPQIPVSLPHFGRAS